MRETLNMEFHCHVALLPESKEEIREKFQQVVASLSSFNILPVGEKAIKDCGFLYPSMRIVRISQEMEGGFLDFLHATRAGQLPPASAVYAIKSDP